MNQEVDITGLLVEAIRNEEMIPVPGDACPDAVLDTARRNRLAGLVGRHLKPATADANWRDTLAAMDLIYQTNLLNSFKGIKVAGLLLAAFEKAGIPCLGLRGPFAGIGLYEDPALRVFSDIDLLIPAGLRKGALSVARSAGFIFADELHSGFFERHHLHWRLEHESGMAVELHWAVEHPFSLYKIDYECLFRTAVPRTSAWLKWMEPRPEHLLILLCLHTVKHCPEIAILTGYRDFPREALANGCLHHWVDIMMFLRRHGMELDWRMVLAEARNWGAMESVREGVGGAARIDPTCVSCEVSEMLGLFGMEMNVPRTRVPYGRQQSGLLDRLAMKGRFRGRCFAEAAYAIIPPVSYFGDRKGIVLVSKRILHAFSTTCRMALMTVEMLFGSGVAWMRRLAGNRRSHAAGFNVRRINDGM